MSSTMEFLRSTGGRDRDVLLSHNCAAIPLRSTLSRFQNW